MPPRATDVRRQFIEFFVDRCGHTEVKSSSVVPHDDPTLLFTNAGMNQFKDVFLGRGNRPFVRAVDSQKCIRAGGKHNDLEDVGRDTYHHTFFEMLGNWSFGDYFKQEAIKWAWELFTQVWGLDKSRLYVTVFEGDEIDGLEADIETEDLWKELTDIDSSHISRWGRKDNFWEMGNTGPCGPCSEIHYDCTPGNDGGHLLNMNDPRVIELWNLVFIQFNRADDGTLTPLPDKHVDTGLGFERIVRILQEKTSNYETDLWLPIFDLITKLTNAPEYGGKIDDQIDIAYRVIADHVRCLVVALTDGGRPGPVGRGYVLRRILRRGTRHAHQTLGIKDPFLYKLVPAVVETLGDAFPELTKNEKHVAQIILEEEESFLKTLDRGLELFEKAVEDGDGQGIDATNAFTLHDTFGFPIDLTEVMAEERGLSVDRDGYESLMEEVRESSKATSDTDKKMCLPPETLGKLELLNIEPTDDSKKYACGISTAHVKAIWNGKELVGKADDSMVFGIILDKTPFYAEQGGQVGDTGYIVLEQSAEHVRCQFHVEETHFYGNYVLHIGHITEGILHCNDAVTVSINEHNRKAITANHTGTHLLNHALRTVLGDDVQQRGSLVGDDRLRFDFSHAHAMTDEQILELERLVNESIDTDRIVDVMDVPLELAHDIFGVRAVFGEQYPNPVRVVSIGATVQELLSNPKNENWGACSIEFCGGTHLESCKGAKHFVVLHEQALASGTRRIIGVTGVAAQASHEAGLSFLQQLEDIEQLEGDSFVNTYDDLVKSIDYLTISQTVRHVAKDILKSLHKRVKLIQKEESTSRKKHVLEQSRVIAELNEDVIVATINGADKDSMMTALDAVRSKRPDGAVILFTADSTTNKVIIVAGVSKSMIAKGLKAGDWVRVAAEKCGGSGGGRPDTAQAGGKEPENVPEAMDRASDFAKEVTQ